jgi:RimJ/RimL family protein N-acetyltransferase
MNADAAVMEYFPSTLSLGESATMIEHAEAGFEADGYGLWSVELPGKADFIGFVGLSPVDLEVPFSPAVEVGWRLARPFWGRGYATEAGSAALAFGFEEHTLPAIVSFTAEHNTRSRAVMARLGMRRDPRGDFDHPLLPERHPLRRHVLYRIDRMRWRRTAAPTSGRPQPGQ